MISNTKPIKAYTYPPACLVWGLCWWVVDTPCGTHPLTFQPLLILAYTLISLEIHLFSIIGSWGSGGAPRWWLCLHHNSCPWQLVQGLASGPSEPTNAFISKIVYFSVKDIQNESGFNKIQFISPSWKSPEVDCLGLICKLCSRFF